MPLSDHQAEELEDLYENAPCGYLSLRADGRIGKVNRTLCGWVGRTPDDILGKRLRDLLTMSGRIFYETHFAPLLRMQGFFDEVALDLVAADGTTLPVLAAAVERRDAAGEVLSTRVTILRAVQRRRYERELVDAQEAAREAQRRLEDLNAALSTGLRDQAARLGAEQEAAALREQFIAVLGHDLRNPLAGLAAGGRMLAKMHDDPQSTRVLHLMTASIARMTGLVENLMDFARGRLGGGIGIRLSTDEPVEPTLLQVVEEMRAAHPDRVIEAAFMLGRPVAADHARLAQLVSNLLGNAVAHGAGDRPVRVEARLDGGEFVLSVANGGEPIPSAAMERLFQPFYRGAEKASPQGLGLGLYIAAQIAEAHGGRIEARSDAQETRFTFRMPWMPDADRSAR